MKRINIDKTAKELIAKFGREDAVLVVTEIKVALSLVPNPSDETMQLFSDYEQVGCLIQHGCTIEEYCESRGIYC